MRAHVAPGSWSRVVSLLHQRRSSFLTRTEIGNRNEVNNQLLSYQTLQTWLSNLPHHRQALVILTFRKDINRSMPSLSNLEGGRGGHSRRKGRSAEVGVTCTDAGRFWGRKHTQLFHRISLQEVTQCTHSWLNRAKLISFSLKAKNPNTLAALIPAPDWKHLLISIFDYQMVAYERDDNI